MMTRYVLHSDLTDIPLATFERDYAKRRALLVLKTLVRCGVTTFYVIKTSRLTSRHDWSEATYIRYDPFAKMFVEIRPNPGQETEFHPGNVR